FPKCRVGVAPPPPLQVSYSRPTSLHDQQLPHQLEQLEHHEQLQEEQEHHQQLQAQPQPQQYHQQPHAYADAYAALGRGHYESTTRAPNNSKV
ncbi:hypothetical protein KR044_007703, partial [Drosophila immigrans]